MILDIWRSYRALPLWVQIWVAGILVPVNMLSLAFLGQPHAALLAVLAIGAMALNGVIMLAERGFSKAMALPHVVIWVPMVLWILGLQASGQVGGSFALYLWVLLTVDAISLALDLRDAVLWWQGDRAVA